MAKDMSNDAAHNILKLHSRRELARDGRPAMTRKMLRAIAGSERDAPDAGADGEYDELADFDQQRKARALARLQVEHPALYGVVWLVDYRGLSLRETGRCLKMSHPTVSKHRAVAFAKVREWCTDMQDAS